MLLYAINKQGAVIFHPDVLNCSPNLAVLTEKEGKLIAFFSDYDLPWGLADDEQRLSMARSRSYGTDEVPDLKLKKYVNAIEEFRACQYSSKKELLRTHERKLVVLEREYEIEDDAKKIKDLLASISTVRVAIKEMHDEVIQEMEKRIIKKGGGDYSFIERTMLEENRKEYLRITTKKK